MSNKSDALLEFVYAHINDLECDWRDPLEELFVWDDVSQLWFGKEPDEANTVFAFIVLAYHNKSRYLEAHKDRYDNKLKIFSKLAGPSFLTREWYRDVLYNFDKIANYIISWFIEFQKDWRWDSIVTGMEYAARANAMSLMGGNSPKEEVDIGKMIKEGKDARRAADALLEEIRIEKVNINMALKKEDRKEMTDMESGNFMRHEHFVLAKQKSERARLGLDLMDFKTDVLEPGEVEDGYDDMPPPKDTNLPKEKKKKKEQP